VISKCLYGILGCHEICEYSGILGCGAVVLGNVVLGNVVLGNVVLGNVVLGNDCRREEEQECPNFQRPRDIPLGPTDA
jgi:hypothetical protein